MCQNIYKINAPIISSLDDKEKKELQLILRLLKNYSPTYVYKIFCKVNSKQDWLNIFWMLNNNRSSFADDLFQTLLKNYKYEHVTSGVTWIPADNNHYKLYRNILAKANN